MPKKLHDKVNELLKSDSFYPDKSEKEREELAWPIATNILKESSFNFKNYRLAQVNQELFKSETIDEFVQKFGTFASTNPNKLIAFNEYLKSALFKGKRLTGYQGFRLFANFLSQNSNRNLTNEEMKISLNTIDKTDANNFVFNEELNKEAPDSDKSDATEADLTKQQSGVNEGNILNNLPGAQKVPGNSGVTGIQDVIQYNSQSAARAPKTEEQIAASERMFMMDNTDALRILSRNIYDVNALRNFEKDLTFSKNHFGTRFEAPVNSMLDLYGQLATTNDRKEKNKIGAQIQYIIQNQLLGSGVRPSVLFNSLRNPNNKTDYLYSGKQAPTPYQFRYLEDVYNGMLPDLRKQFEEDRKAFADDYIKKHPDVVEAGKELPEQFYPDELKQVAKPGSPIHQRTWTEGNGKQVLKSAFGEEQPSESAQGPSTGVRPLVVGPASDGLKLPETIKPGDARLGPNKEIIPRPTFNFKDLKATPAPPPSGETKTTANRINKFNLFKHS